MIMTGHNPKSEVLRGREVRRRRTAAEKLAIIAETVYAMLLAQPVATDFRRPDLDGQFRDICGAYLGRPDALDGVFPASPETMPAAVHRMALIVAAHLFAAGASAQAADVAPTVLITSVAPGEEAMDRDAFGGNPLASALVKVAEDRHTAFRDALPRLLELTAAYSDELHHPVAGALADDGWRLGVPAPGERRVALVAVFAEYRLDTQLPSLPGAGLSA